MLQMYGVSLAIMLVCWTRWNSSQMCLASLLRVSSACRELESEHHLDDAFPLELVVFGDSSWWRRIASAEKIARPLVRASLLLERDGLTAGDVVFIFFAIVHSVNHSEEAQACVEKRWLKFEHPVFVMGLLFHPKYQAVAKDFLRKQEDDESVFSSRFLSKAAAAYFAKQFRTANRHVEDQMRAYVDALLEDKLPEPIECNDEDSTAMYLRYWHAMALRWHSLSKLALVILSLVVHSVTCERMFKELLRS